MATTQHQGPIKSYKQGPGQPGQPRGPPPELIKQFIGSLCTLAFVVCLISFLYIIRATMWQTILILCGANLAATGMGIIFGVEFKPRVMLKNLVFIAGFTIAIYSLSGLGSWGALLGIGLVIVYVFWSRWRRFVSALRHLETMWYGKPLERGLWKPGELSALPRKKFVWRKSHGNNARK